MVKALDPEGDLKYLLADKIVADAWRLRRVPMLEAAVHRRSRHDRAIQNVQEVVNEARSVETAAMLSSITRIPVRADYRVEAERTLQEVKTQKTNLYLRHPILEASRVLETSVVVFANLWRHERALTHAIHRTLHELQRLQAMRQRLQAMRQRLQAMRRGEVVPAPEMIDLHLHADLASSAETSHPADLDLQADPALSAEPLDMRTSAEPSRGKRGVHNKPNFPARMLGKLSLMRRP
jgi:hypothetical protein